jgi:uncharacterized protein
MNPFEEHPPPPEHAQEPQESAGTNSAEPAAQEFVPPAPGQPDPYAYPVPVAAEVYPPDLRISWGWVHFLVFVFFSFLSVVVVPAIMLLSTHPKAGLTSEEMQAYFLSKPELVIGSMVVSYGFIFLFLYVTLALLRGHPFWESLGWRKLSTSWPKFFFGGTGLSVLVAVVNSRTKTPDNIPIEELFKHKETAMLFVAMAVLVAPLVEETLFRGYLYPLVARTAGMGWGIVVTGTLFGLMHGAQLGWNVFLIGTLIFVGIVFTAVRAKTGSVLASFLMHLGYNSLIAVATVVSTHGFTALPSAK